MDADQLLRALSQLAGAATRLATLEHLAAQLGAEALFVFVPHPDVPGRLIPAPGCTRTVPSGRGWRELLARCGESGTHAGEVAFPSGDLDAPAIAYAYPRVTIIAVGHARADHALADALSKIAPLLAALLDAEQQVVVTHGELEVAREATDRASTLANALEIARREAVRAMRAKDEFLAMLGHELRNPLAPILTAVHMLRLEGQQTRIHDILERQLGHLLRLVDDLLDVSRITRGKIELRREHVEIASVVAHAVEIASPLLEQKRNQLVIEVPSRGLTVHGDPARLAQAVSNLITNAAKYSDAQSRIRIAAERVGPDVRIAVEDQGIGIEPSYLERVFEQFVQIPQGLDRSAGGLGLGLAIVRSLVAMHGGTVRAFSEGRGRGSCFVVELPFATPRPAAAATPAAAAGHAVATATASVMIVDDNCDAAELLRDALLAFGYAVEVVYSSPDALALVERFTPDIALLDIGLPVMDGYELARALRTRLPATRLVAVTGYGRPGDRERARDAGFSAHLVKPVSIASVTETLRALLP